MSSKPVNNRILVIDDDAVVRDSIRHILNPPLLQHPDLADLSSLLFEQDDNTSLQQHEVYLIHEAENGLEGITKVHQSILNHTPYALVLLDMRMPGIDGLQTCEKIREIDPQAKICFLTAFSDHTPDVIIRRAGPDVGYLAKPFAPEEILQLVSKATHDWGQLDQLHRLIHLLQGSQSNGKYSSHDDQAI